MDYESLVKPPRSRCLKSGKVTLNPGESVGEHVTDNREELIVCLEGMVKILLPDTSAVLSGGHTYYIPSQTVHNVKNCGDVQASYVYVVALFDKDDYEVVRKT